MTMETIDRGTRRRIEAWRAWLKRDLWRDLFHDGRLGDPDSAAITGMVRDFARRTVARAWIAEGRDLCDVLATDLRNAKRSSVKIDALDESLRLLEEKASIAGETDVDNARAIDTAVGRAAAVIAKFGKDKAKPPKRGATLAPRTRRGG